MWKSKKEYDDIEAYDLNPYDSFMRKHLQHYGYFTGRNQNYRNSFRSYADWEKNHVYHLDSESDSDSDDERKGCQDNRTQEELLRTTQLVYNFESGKMIPKLREPRNLYALNKEAGPQQAARWPSDLQVENGRIHHIRYIPTEPEPLYKLTGLEKTPMVRGEENGGKVVFQYEPKSSFFIRSRVGGSRNGCENYSYTPESPDDTTLVFESRFESGNLAKAVKVGENDYELHLRYDLYTSKHTQWYYFRVRNTRPNINYRFTIVNLMKPDSLYNYGMKPLMYSEKTAQLKKIGWIRCGSNIKYYRNNLKYDTAKGERPFYSLTWTTQLQNSNDDVYFAHCFPYTYTDLQDYLLELGNDPIKSRICKQRVLCRTIAGNLVYLLTITSPSQNPEDLKHKRAVVITSRVHPGESNASWMMKGFLDYLTGNSADAKLLRDTFIFKIVPMLNPDGVVVGNYRCSLAGRDLNRNYKTMLKDSYPSVWHTRNMIRKLTQEREVVVYCDLHGHSRKQNVFIYGCENKNDPNRRLRERIFPCMLSKNAPTKFSFDGCKFKVQKSKEGTGRIVVWNMGVLNSFTLEATFCGSSLGKQKGHHFSVGDFESLGYHFCDTLLDYCDPDNTKSANILVNLEEKLKMEIIHKMEKEGVTSLQDININDFSTDESSDGGSDSSVSDGPPVHLQYTNQRSLKKKKKLKSRKERDQQNQRPAKDESKKEKKPTSGHQMSHDKQDQVNAMPSQPLRYMMTHKRPRSTEEKAIISAPTEYIRSDERNKRNDYLEALTVAYLKNGIPLLNDPVPHLRYSGSDRSMTNVPFSLEGLCPHHEQTFAAHYVAHQLNSYGVYCEGTGQLRGSKVHVPTTKGKKVSEAEAKPALSNLRLPTGVRGNSYFKIWKLTARPDGNQYSHNTEDNKSAKRFPSQYFDIATSQTSKDIHSNIGSRVDKGKLLKQHPNPFDEKLSPHKKDKQLYVKSQLPSETGIIGYSLVDSLVEDSEPAETPEKEHFTESDGDWVTLTQKVCEEKNRSHSRNSLHDKNGRKSRMGMHSDEEKDENVNLKPIPINKKPSKSFIQPSPKSAPKNLPYSKRSLSNATSETIKNIQELKISTASPVPQDLTSSASISSMTTNMTMPINISGRQSSHRKSYIQKMIQEATDEIEVLEKEIKDEIVEKKLARERKEITVLQEKISKTRSPAIEKSHGESRVKGQRCSRHSEEVNASSVVNAGMMEGDGSNSFRLQRELSSASNSSQDRKQLTSDTKENLPARNKSAKSSRQLFEATPTRISLMICQDHHDGRAQFLPLHSHGTSRPQHSRLGKRKF